MTADNNAIHWRNTLQGRSPQSPHTCPYCKGTGLVIRPPHIAGDATFWYATTTGPYQCKVCNGGGVLWL